MSNQSTSNASKLRKFTHASSGRPPLKDAYPQLHPAIVELATARAGANFRSRTDVLNACKNLDDLHAGLLKEIIFWAANLCISVLFQEDQTQSKENVMSGQFLLTLERHKMPFEINTLRNFCFATNQYMKDIASLFGAENMFVLSVDDKAKVPIRVTAANKQSPLIMARWLWNSFIWSWLCKGYEA